MTNRGRRTFWKSLLAIAVPVLALGGCGGSGNPLNNPPPISNSAGAAGQSLSFAYFQYCVNPIFDAVQTNALTGVQNTCSNAGCHASATGRGGAFRVVPGAVAQALSDSPATLRMTAVYENFISAQGETIVGDYAQSLLINKPLVRNVLHGGGQIIASDTDPGIKKIEYWISNPMPAGQDEFSQAGYNLFSDPANPGPATCNTLP